MKNLKHILGGIGLGAMALTTCGCETPGQTRALGTLMQLGAANSRNNLNLNQRQGLSIIGNALENQAQDQAMVRAAREGRDQIIINVPQTQSYQEQNRIEIREYPGSDMKLYTTSVGRVEGEKGADINGVWVKEGYSIGKFYIEEIKNSEVILRYNGNLYRLTF